MTNTSDYFRAQITHLYIQKTIHSYMRPYTTTTPCLHLKTALKSKKKRVLPLSPRDPNIQGGAVFWDPASKARADQRMRDAEMQEMREVAAKADRKLQRLNNKIARDQTKVNNKKKAEQEREETAQRRAQEAREREEKAAEKARLKALNNAPKVSKSPKQVRSKASKKSQSKTSKRGGDAAEGGPQVAHEPSSAPRGVRTRSGRVTKLTKKLS
jgi:hypothetical protein